MSKITKFFQKTISIDEQWVHQEGKD